MARLESPIRAHPRLPDIVTEKLATNATGPKPNNSISTAGSTPRHARCTTATACTTCSHVLSNVLAGQSTLVHGRKLQNGTRMSTNAADPSQYTPSQQAHTFAKPVHVLPCTTAAGQLPLALMGVVNLPVGAPHRKAKVRPASFRTV